MNIKAERIEQLIQIVNRNLQLIFSGQSDGITTLDQRPLQKVDAVVFAQDKFAYEMVYFLTSAKEKLASSSDDSLFSTWEANFVTGLENLLVECAVISDEIERDCFISRVYCWFTEKLTERREVPRKSVVTVEDLKLSVAKFTDTGEHTMKALNLYDPNAVVDHRSKLLEEPVDPNAKFGPPETKSLPPINARLQANFPEGMKKIPSYVRHNYPNVFLNQSHDSELNFLPKISNSTSNFGMLYNKPETEAEKKMNELWLARRRQEAFDYKTQQQLAIVMDRLALHKARLESDALRKYETEAMLKVSKQRPSSANDALAPSKTEGLKNLTTRGIAQKLRRDLTDLSPSPDGRQRRSRSPKARTGGESIESKSNQTTRNDPITEEGSVSVVMNDGEKEAIVPAPARTGVLKGGKKVNAPMRFKLDLPDGYVERQSYYMQLSDSDDDDKPDRPMRSVQHGSATRSGGGKKKGSNNANAKVDIRFKHERPIIRERPTSAKQFRTIAVNDPEIKIHYRFTNYRRMPLTGEQELWLEDRETNRVKKSEEVAKKLFEAFQAKSDKKKDKDKGKKDGKEKKDKNDSKSRPGSGKSATDNNPDSTKKKYKSATQFMSTHFPNFDQDEDFEKVAPMRRLQLMEVASVTQAFADYNIPIKESALRKALIIPQDKPEALCLENLRGEKDGLLKNPNPPEYWRKMVVKKGGKKGKKKK